jgi:hypothetical protein
LGLAVFILPLCTNAIVTTLIVIRIWYLSPEKRRDMLGANFPTGVGRTAIVMVIESGMLYVAVQLVFVILFAVRHPAQAIIAGIVVQVYVRIRHLKGKSLWNRYLNHTGHRTDTDSHPHLSRLLTYAIRTDFHIRVAARVNIVF